MPLGAAAGRPAERLVMLYLFDEINRLRDDFPELAFSMLSEQRRAKAFAYRFPEDRKLSAAVYLLLRLGLREDYGIDEPVVFVYGENGKPFLRDYPGIHFNLSHCRAAAACAIAGSPVGVDAQEIRPVSDKAAQYALSPGEYEEYRAARDPARRFCELWTAKESYLKRTGQGIGTDLTALSAQKIPDKALFVNGPVYCACVCGPAGPLRRIGAEGLIPL